MAHFNFNDLSLSSSDLSTLRTALIFFKVTRKELLSSSDDSLLVQTWQNELEASERLLHVFNEGGEWEHE